MDETNNEKVSIPDDTNLPNPENSIETADVAETEVIDYGKSE